MRSLFVAFTLLTCAVAPSQKKLTDDELQALILSDIGERSAGGRIGVLKHATKCPVCKRRFRKVQLSERASVEGTVRRVAWVCEKDRLYFLHGHGGMHISEGGPFVLPSKEGEHELGPIPYGARKLRASMSHRPKWNAELYGPELDLAAGSRHDSTLTVWRGDKDLVQDRGMMGVTAMAFAPRLNACAITRSGGKVRIYTLPAGKNVATLGGPFRNIVAMAIDPKVQRLAAFSFVRSEPELRIRRIPNGKTLLKLEAEGMQGPVVSRWSPDGRFLAIGDVTGLVNVWDLKTGGKRTTRVRVGKRLNHVVFSNDGSRLAALSDGGSLAHVLEPGSGKTLLAFDAGKALAGTATGLPEIAFSPKNKAVAWLRKDGFLFLVDLAAPRQGRKSLGAAMLSYLRFPAAKTFVTLRHDGVFVDWDVDKLLPNGGIKVLRTK